MSPPALVHECPAGGCSLVVALFALCGGLVVRACVRSFSPLGVFVVVCSFSFVRFGFRFGLVVRGGRWVFVSCRSGRVLSGGAFLACRAALLRCGLVSAAFLAGSSAFPGVLVPGAFSSSSAPRPSRSRASFLPVPVPAPVVPVPPASASGSALFLSSPAFSSALASGLCPVSLCLSVFRWPVRSAVLLCLLRVCSAPAVLRSVPRSLLSSFCAVGLASLGFRGAFLSCPPSVVLRFLGGFPLPVVPRFSGVCRSSAVCSAFSALSRCLAWLGSPRGGGRGCPPACRGALAGLLLRVFRFLAL